MATNQSRSQTPAQPNPGHPGLARPEGFPAQMQGGQFQGQSMMPNQYGQYAGNMMHNQFLGQYQAMNPALHQAQMFNANHLAAMQVPAGSFLGAQNPNMATAQMSGQQVPNAQAQMSGQPQIPTQAQAPNPNQPQMNANPPVNAQLMTVINMIRTQPGAFEKLDPTVQRIILTQFSQYIPPHIVNHYRASMAAGAVRPPGMPQQTDHTPGSAQAPPANPPDQNTGTPVGTNPPGDSNPSTPNTMQNPGQSVVQASAPGQSVPGQIPGQLPSAVQANQYLQIQAQLYQSQMQQQLYMQQMNQFRPQAAIPSNLYTHYHQLQQAQAAQAQALQAGQNPNQQFLTAQYQNIMQMNPMFAQNPRHPLPPGAAIGLQRPGAPAVTVPGVAPARPVRQPSVHAQNSSNAPTPQPNPSTPQTRPNLPPTPQTAPGSSSIPIRPNPNMSIPPTQNGASVPQSMVGATPIPGQQFQPSAPTAVTNMNAPQTTTPIAARPTHIALPPNNLNIRPNQPPTNAVNDKQISTSNAHHLTQEAIKTVESFVQFFRNNPQSKMIDYWSNLFKKHFVADARLHIQLKNNGSQQSQMAPQLDIKGHAISQAFHSLYANTDLDVVYNLKNPAASQVQHQIVVKCPDTEVDYLYPNEKSHVRGSLTVYLTHSMKIEHWIFQYNHHEETKTRNTNPNEAPNDDYSNPHNASAEKFNEFGFKENPFMVHLMTDVCKNLLPIIQMTDQLKISPADAYAQVLSTLGHPPTNPLSYPPSATGPDGNFIPDPQCKISAELRNKLPKVQPLAPPNQANLTQSSAPGSAPSAMTAAGSHMSGSAKPPTLSAPQMPIQPQSKMPNQNPGMAPNNMAQNNAQIQHQMQMYGMIPSQMQNQRFPPGFPTNLPPGFSTDQFNLTMQQSMAQAGANAPNNNATYPTGNLPQATQNPGQPQPNQTPSQQQTPQQTPARPPAVRPSNSKRNSVSMESGAGSAPKKGRAASGTGPKGRGRKNQGSTNATAANSMAAAPIAAPATAPGPSPKPLPSPAPATASATPVRPRAGAMPTSASMPNQGANLSTPGQAKMTQPNTTPPTTRAPMNK